MLWRLTCSLSFFAALVWFLSGLHGIMYPENSLPVACSFSLAFANAGLSMANWCCNTKDKHESMLALQMRGKMIVQHQEVGVVWRYLLFASAFFMLANLTIMPMALNPEMQLSERVLVSDFDDWTFTGGMCFIFGLPALLAPTAECMLHSWNASNAASAVVARNVRKQQHSDRKQQQHSDETQEGQVSPRVWLDLLREYRELGQELNRLWCGNAGVPWIALLMSDGCISIMGGVEYVTTGLCWGAMWAPVGALAFLIEIYVMSSVSRRVLDIQKAALLPAQEICLQDVPSYTLFLQELSSQPIGCKLALPFIGGVLVDTALLMKMAQLFGGAAPFAMIVLRRLGMVGQARPP